MDGGSDKRSNMKTGKEEGASANLKESLNEDTVAREDLDLGVKEVTREEPTFEGLLKENQELKATVEELKEDIRRFQEKQITFLELSEALKVAVKEVHDRIKRSGDTEILEMGALALGPDECRLTKRELAEILRENEELKLTVQELRKSTGSAKEVREKVKSEMQVGKLTNALLTPSLIFSDNVWERILGKLEDSKDILNVLKAVPGLEGRVLKNKYWWLFDQVVPHLRGWVNNKELLLCRLVCKKWAHGVDNHLENLPFRNVVEHGLPITGQVWHPEGSRAYDDYKFWAWNIRGCEVSFRHTKKITQFLRDADTHPPTRNPFLGRSVKFYIPESSRRADNDQVAYLDAAMKILQRYGSHVWFLDLSYFGKNFRRLVLDVIYFVPNLKALKLCGSTFDGHVWDRNVLFPHLPNLKSLNLDTFNHFDAVPRNFIHLFVIPVSAQLQRLSIHQSSWMREYDGVVFPNLRELYLNGDGFHNEIVDILTSLNAPNLYKLWIEVRVFEFRGALELADIFSWIKPFPILQHLVVYVTGDTDDYGEQVVGPRSPDCFPSIKSVSISWLDVHVLGPAFLHCFPSLEYADIVDSYTFDEDNYYFRPEWVVSKNVYQWGLWKELASLKEIRFAPEPRPGLPTHYNRTTYELLNHPGDLKIRKNKNK